MVVIFMTKLILQTDGGARGNPGPAGAGIVIRDYTGAVLHKFHKFLGDNLTNNEAEYLALIFGLENLNKVAGEGSEIEIQLDSELVVKQLRGEYKIKEARLKALAAQVKAATATFPTLTYTHIRREQNSLADELANEAMDSAQESNRGNE